MEWEPRLENSISFIGWKWKDFEQFLLYAKKNNISLRIGVKK